MRAAPHLLHRKFTGYLVALGAIVALDRLGAMSWPEIWRPNDLLDYLIIYSIVYIGIFARSSLLSTGRRAYRTLASYSSRTDRAQPDSLFASVLMDMPIGIAIFSPEYKLIFANNKYYEMLNITSEHERRIWLRKDRNVKDRAGKKLEFADWPVSRALRLKERVAGKELFVQLPDGSHRWLSTDAVPVFGSDGQLRAALVALFDITTAKQAVRDRQSSARNIIAAQEEERLRLARELHDEMGQILTALSLDLHSAMDAGPSELAKGRVSHAAGLVDQLNSKVHDTAWSLRPAALEHVNVREAVEDLVNTWSAHLGIAADVSLEALTHPIGKETAETIYRVVQEALTNVAKHSGASRICVTAQKLVAHLRITIEDDGHGFDGFATPADAHRFGIAGMRERLALVGGDLSIEARSGEGTTLYVDLPMAERRGEA